jgi:hypothetical protein
LAQIVVVMSRVRLGASHDYPVVRACGSLPGQIPQAGDDARAGDERLAVKAELETA